MERMMAYTVRPGLIEPGIRLAQDGMIHLGQQGRGRTLTRVPVPCGTIAPVPADLVEAARVGNRPTLTALPGEGAVVCIRDHSGFRGSWTLDAPHYTIRATGQCAQGDAGRMGGGPEHLLVLPPGQHVLISRTGRLYGAPAILEVRCAADGLVTLHDVEDEARTAAAGVALVGA